jgi:hypothetical protein
MPRSSTPADRSHQAFTMQAMLPSANLTTSAPHQYHSRGSITRPAGPLCTLRSRDHSRSTQHSVPAGGQPLPGQDLHLLGRSEGFRHACPSTWLPPSPSFAWRKPGGHGRLLARGSHRSGRAQFGHPAPRTMVSLRDEKHCEPHAVGGADSARSNGQISPTSSGHARSDD